MKTTASFNDSVRSRMSSVSASSACSTPSLDTSLPVTPAKSGGGGDKAATESPAADPYRTPEFYIIRVSLESSTEATEGRALYVHQ